VLKPLRVLETGTHHGVSATYIAMALRENDRGMLDTLEFLPENWKIADDRFERLNLKGYVKNIQADVANFVPNEPYQMILLDTEPQTRFKEMKQFWDHLELGGYLFIHDLHRHMHQIPNEEHGFAWPYGPVTKFMTDLVKNREARPFHFPTPRGLTGFYKVHPEDYKWPEQ